MHWVILTLVAALFLGAYELFTKHAVNHNAVLPVLFFSTVTGASVWIVLMTIQAVHPGLLPRELITDPLSLKGHLLMASKSAIVAASWVATYFAMKHLPLSIASPVRSTAPVWVFVAALVALGERPTVLESVGILITIASCIALSLAGREEGIEFHRNKWIGVLAIGTAFGVASAVFDKYLLGHLHFRTPTVQAWFSIYLAVFFLMPAIGWKRRWWPRNEFHWRWSIPFIALALLVSDYLYFSALRSPEALVSLVSSLRRGSTLVAFAGGLYFFKERNGGRKLPAVIGVIIGILLTVA